MTVYLSLAISVGIVMAYMYLSARLTRFVQPMRIDVVDAAESLIADPEVPENVKKSVDAISNCLLVGRVGWLFVLLFPIRSVIFRLRGRRNQAQATALTSVQQKKYRFVQSVGMFCIFANSPMVLLIAGIEIAIMVAIRAPVGGVTRSIVRENANGDQNPQSTRLAGA